MKSYLGRIVSGFLLGMILQVAVGPVCLYLINVSILNSFSAGFAGAVAATIADAVFIFLGVVGVSRLLTEHRVKVFRLLGGTLLIAFGLATILSFTGLELGSNTLASSLFGSKNVFLFTFLLTLSSPLSIIFWSGIFSVKIMEERYEHMDLFLFSLGCLLATLFFLTVVVSAAVVAQRILTPSVIQILNIFVGVVIVYFGIRLFLTITENDFVRSEGK